MDIQRQSRLGKKLDEFPKMSDNEILTHAGRISHHQATQKALEEYEKI